MIRIAQPLLGADEEWAVIETLRSGRLAQGPRVEAFERAFAGYTGASFAVAVSSSGECMADDGAALSPSPSPTDDLTRLFDSWPNRVLGRGGSVSRMTRCISASPPAYSVSRAKGGSPASSSYNRTPSA